MGRKRNRRKKNKGNKMNIVTKNHTVVNRIKDEKDANIFGIHLTTQKALDDFQEKSGMKGPYSVEYQHHYWAAVGRMEAGGQVLDVAIPLVMFNYPQTVSGASVKFNMAQVEDMSIQLTELAVAKCKEFMESCGKKMSETFGLQWSYVPTHTLHVHPGSLSSFSGTDYDKNPTDPGIVYPLSEATDQASFSSIVCHVGSKAKLVRTEYRLFTGTHEGEKKYRHGKCLSYVKRDLKENGPIEAMFIGNKAIEESYVFKDGFIQNQGDDLLAMLSKIFDESNFEPSTDFILKDNITKGFGQTARGFGGRYSPTRSINTPVQKTMFNNKDDVEDYTQVEISQMRTFIVAESDFTWKNVINMEDPDILFFYKEAVNGIETKRYKDIPVALVVEEEETTLVEDVKKLEELEIDSKEEDAKQYEFLTEIGITDMQIMSMSDKSILEALTMNGYFLDTEDIQEIEVEVELTTRQMEENLFLLENGFAEDEIDAMTESQVKNAIATLEFTED